MTTMDSSAAFASGKCRSHAAMLAGMIWALLTRPRNPVNQTKAPPAPMREIVIPAAQSHYGRSVRLVVPWSCIHCGAPRGTHVQGESTCSESGLKLLVSAWATSCGHRETYEDVRKQFDL